MRGAQERSCAGLRSPRERAGAATPRSYTARVSGRTAGDAPVRHRDTSRREEILQAAALTFASHGYAGSSLRDVADASGILPGSLYHHFDSKAAIAVELIDRYRRELDGIAEAVLAGRGAGPVDRPLDSVIEMGVAIAECAVRNRAALQLMLFEAGTGAGSDLAALTSQRATPATEAAMQELLTDADAIGELAAGLDLALLAAHLCEIMLHVGLTELHRDGAGREVASLLLRLLLTGIALHPPTDGDLDGSAAMAAARRCIKTWEDADPDTDARMGALLSAARVEFARRGYEATTVRDIAAASGMGTGSVYRLVESKEALLASIMNSFHTRLSEAYDAVIAAPGSAVRKLDALVWVNLSAAERFSREFDIQRSWFRASPPDTKIVGDTRAERSAQVRDLLVAARRSGEIGFADTPMDALAACVRDLIWVPPSVALRVTRRACLAHARATLLRGAMAAGVRRVRTAH